MSTEVTEDLRTRISLAAQDLLLRDGIEGVSMRKVAERVGITAPAIYRHYRDKDELLNEVIVAGLKILEGYLAPALAAEDPLVGLRALIERYLDFAIEQPKYFEFAFLVPSRKVRGLSDELADQNWGTFRLAVGQVAACMDRGLLRRADPLEVSVMIWATVHGLVTLFRMERFGTGVEEFRLLYARTVDRVLDSLKAS